MDGGYLSLANDTDLKINPEQWAVAIRMRDPNGTWRWWPGSGWSTLDQRGGSVLTIEHPDGAQFDGIVFGDRRRIYAGFLGDGGWGGNSVLRELVQDENGWLGTRFVPEMVPECGEPLSIEASVRLEAKGKRRFLELPEIPADFRQELEIAPEAGTTPFGIGPFLKHELPDVAIGEDISCGNFFSIYLVEVFANDRQAVVAAHLDYHRANGLRAYTFGAPTTIKTVDIWKLKPTNQGYPEAQKRRIWEPEIK